MPPKPKIAKEDIAACALNIIRRNGIGALTAKAVSAEMKCSTQPIFWYYSGMKELKEDLYKEAIALFDAGLKVSIEGVSPYKSIGLNYIRFAAEEKECFKWLFMSGNNNDRDILSSHAAIPYVLDVLEKTENITGSQARAVFEEMWMLVHGIATMIATETAQFSEDKIQQMLTDVYRGLITNLSTARKK